MNKSILSFLSLMLVAGAAFAQTGFQLYKTSYVGALSGDAAADWTTNWTNFDPKNTAYPAVTDTTTLNGMLTSLPTPGEVKLSGTVTLNASSVYLLKGLVVIPDGAKLVIPAGTVIRALANTSTTPKNYASIVVERGGKIEVNGTAAAPVVMTSAKAVNARERGDWGGLMISGRGKHNLSNAAFDNVQMEGFNNVSFDASLAKFGGNDNDDNSGSITYLRIEFGGLAFETNKEINALTFGAVGKGTVVHNVQASYSGDDSFEWFGGAVCSRYLIAYKGTDDDFDTDNGYSGLSQFGLAVRDTAYYDLTYSLASGASTSEAFESDNEATGTAATSFVTNGIFSNFTLVGPVPMGTTYSSLASVHRSAFRRGARIRRNSSLRIANSIFMGYRNFVMIDGDSSVRNTNYPAALALVTPSTAVSVDKTIGFTNNLICNTASAFTSTTDTTANGLVEVARAKGSAAKLAAIDAWVRQTLVAPLSNNINPVAFTTGTLLENPSAYTTTPNFRPVTGSPALAGAEFDLNPVLVNITTAVDEIATAEKMAPVYPNPAKAGGVVNFGREVASFGIFDINGRLVTYGLDTDHADLSTLSTGIYFIKMNGQMQKLIVE